MTVYYVAAASFILGFMTGGSTILVYATYKVNKITDDINAQARDLADKVWQINDYIEKVQLETEEHDGPYN